MTKKTLKVVISTLTLTFILSGCAKVQEAPIEIPEEPVETAVETPVETPVEAPVEDEKEPEEPEEIVEVITEEPVEEKVEETPASPVKETFTIKNMTGKSLSDAKSALSIFNLKIVEEHSDSVGKGLVITQNPKSGEKEKGIEVEVRVSLGKKAVAVVPKPNPTPTPASKPAPAPKPEPTPAPKPQPTPVVTPEPKPVPVSTPAPKPTGITIPDGTGKNLDSFINGIQANMSFEITTAEHDTIAKDVIIKMITPPGVYPENSVIKVMVSAGKPIVEAPKQADGLNLPKIYPSSASSSHENEIVRLLNEYRVANGLNPLEVRSDLVKSARYKSDSELQFNYFSHDNPHLGGISFSSLMYSQFNYHHYNGVGENLHFQSGGTGYSSAENIMTNWKNSPGHNTNMLRPEWKYVGVGVITSQTSGSKFGGLPAIISTQHFGH